MQAGPDVSELLRLVTQYQERDLRYDEVTKTRVESLFRQGIDLFTGLPVRVGKPADGPDLKGEKFLLTEQLPYKYNCGEIPLQVRGLVVRKDNIALGGIDFVTIEAVAPSFPYGRQELYRIHEQGLSVAGRIVVREFDLVNSSPENRTLVLRAHQIMNHFAANLPSRPSRVG